MIAGIRMQYNEMQSKIIDESYEQEDVHKEVQQQMCEKIQIEKKSVKEMFPQERKFIKMNDEVTEMIVYAPNLFKKIRDMNEGLLDFNQHLNFEKNYQNIQKSSSSHSKYSTHNNQHHQGGGVSGEFLMFTHDNMLVLKTVKDREMDEFRKYIFEYYKYLHDNPHSLIAQIYGLYSFSKPMNNNN